MKQYLDSLRHILDNGVSTPNRTKFDTIHTLLLLLDAQRHLPTIPFQDTNDRQHQELIDKVLSSITTVDAL